MSYCVLCRTINSCPSTICVCAHWLCTYSYTGILHPYLLNTHMVWKIDHITPVHPHYSTFSCIIILLILSSLLWLNQSFILPRLQIHTGGLRILTQRRRKHLLRLRMQWQYHIWSGAACGRPSKSDSPSCGTILSTPALLGEVTATSSSWTLAFRIRGT